MKTTYTLPDPRHCLFIQDVIISVSYSVGGYIVEIGTHKGLDTRLGNIPKEEVYERLDDFGAAVIDAAISGRSPYRSYIGEYLSRPMAF